MKRVKAACICQTLHFLLKDDLGHDYAVRSMKRLQSTKPLWTRTV